MNWVKTSERLPEANNDYYAVYITKDNNTFLSVALYGYFGGMGSSSILAKVC